MIDFSGNGLHVQLPNKEQLFLFSLATTIFIHENPDFLLYYCNKQRKFSFKLYYIYAQTKKNLFFSLYLCF